MHRYNKTRNKLKYKNMNNLTLTPKKIKFPIAKKIDYTKYIEPKKQIFETKNNLTIAILISI